jgi:DNA-binding transcriptional LysR family regulator
MTLAAKELAMTQPGVTQHIRNLEKVLSLQFFHRNGKRLIPSKEAEVLYESLNDSLEKLESVLF